MFPFRSSLQFSSLMQWLRWLFVAVLAGSLAYFVWFTWHWQMLVNAPVMHYVNFLMSHGLKPYTDITDMNMPGAYLLERVGMTVFGGGDLGWRMYDFFLAAVTIGCMVVITKPYDWLAGVYAGGLFALRHGSEGAWFSGEREQEMMVLLVAACALLFVSVRRQRPLWCMGFGIFAGLAASIKPTLAPFGLLALALLWLALRQRKRPVVPYLAWAVAGLLTPLVCTAIFFLHYHAWHPFLFVLRIVTPVYVALNDPGKRTLVRHVAPDEWLPLFFLGSVCFLLLRRSWDWERAVLLLGAGCGLLSYFVQHKGFFYQRYTFMAFALLLVSLEIFTPAALGWVRLSAATALLYGALYVCPLYLRALRLLPGPSQLTLSMEADLAHMGGDRLQREVQCFDITYGCLNSLYHLGLVENTGFTGDLLLFPMKPNRATDYYRALFWRLQKARPAEVIVMTTQDIVPVNSFNRLARWPEFVQYLGQNYNLLVERSFPYEDKFKGQAPAPPGTAPAYRIYVRKEAHLAVPK